MPYADSCPSNSVNPRSASGWTIRFSFRLAFKMSIRRNTAYNVGGSLVPAVIFLVCVPAYLSFLGEERYGVLALVWLITGNFGFFDFGLGRATAFALSNNPDDTDEQREKVFWTALGINFVFGLLGAALMYLIAPWLFGGIIKVPDDLSLELDPVIPLIALAIPLLTLEGVLTGALTGRQEFLALNIRSILRALITQIIPLAAVWFIAPTLTVAIPATIAARAISVALFVVIAFKVVPARWLPRFGDMKIVRELTAYGGWISIGAFLGQIITNLDRFLIGAVIGPAAVTTYEIPFNLVSRAAVFSRALSSAIFPKLAELEKDELIKLTKRAMRANGALMTVLCVFGIAIMEPFLVAWIGRDLAARSAPVGEVVIISLWLNALSLIPHSGIEAQGRPRVTAAIKVAILVPYLGLAYSAVTMIGIVAVAIARNLRSAIELLLLAGQARLLGFTLRLSALPFLALIAAIANARLLGTMTPAGVIVAALICIASALWAIHTSGDMRRILEGTFMRVLERMRG